MKPIKHLEVYLEDLPVNAVYPTAALFLMIVENLLNILIRDLFGAVRIYHAGERTSPNFDVYVQRETQWTWPFQFNHNNVEFPLKITVGVNNSWPEVILF